MTQSIFTLKGSHREPLKGHSKGKELAANKVLTASLQTPTAMNQRQIDELVRAVQTGKRAVLTPQELEKVLGSKFQHVRKITQSVHAAGLTVLERSQGDRSHGIIRIKGTYARFKRFSPGLVLHEFKDKAGNTVIAREGSLSVLGNLPITGFFGLDEREVAHTNFRIHSQTGSRPQAIPEGLTARGLAKLQGWDVEEMDTFARVTGYISLGGDNSANGIGKDLAATAKAEGIKAAQFIRVSTDGSPNGAYSDDATVEDTLDLTGQALLNPNGAVVAFTADNTDDGFLGAGENANTYQGVTINGTLLKLIYMSVSWGSGEVLNKPDTLTRWQRIATAGQLVGIDWDIATGDNGPDDNTPNPTPDTPSDTPLMGGAAGIGINVVDGKITDIHPWDDTASGGGMTGYGISAVIPPMPEEARLNLPVSVVTGQPGHSASLFSDLAEPASGPTLLYNKKKIKVGGTSFSGPFQTAKKSYLKVKHGITSFIALAYASGEHMVDQITTGDDSGPYPASATALYNVMTGFGVLNYAKANAVCAASKKAA